jgi:hypothetical protein
MCGMSDRAHNWLKKWSWFHVTRLLAVGLMLYGVIIEKDPGNRGTCITAAFGLLGAEPVARREKSAPPRKKDE